VKPFAAVMGVGLKRSINERRGAYFVKSGGHVLLLTIARAFGLSENGGCNDIHFHPVEPFQVRVGIERRF
jgi:hypothetical protein